MGWMAAAQIGGEILDSWISSSSGHKNNRTQIEMAREQREWEKEMANTAMQRRVEDLKKSGLNPVLAAGGPGAAVPSVSVPSTQPTFQHRGFGNTAAAALMLRQQAQLTAAQTADVTASARIKNVEASIREELSVMEREFRANKFVEESEWNNLRTKILRSEDTSSAAEAKRLRETADSMIQLAKQQAEAGKLDLEALRNVASIGGLEAGKTQWVLKLIMDIWRTAKEKGR